MRRNHLNHSYLFAAYVLCLGFFVFVARPDLDNSTATSWLSDDFFILKVLHWIVYMSNGMAWLSNLLMLIPLAYFLGKFYPRARSRVLLVICIAVSVGIELAQVFIPGRVPDVRDVLANGAGVAVWLYSDQFIQRTKAHRSVAKH